MIKLKDEKTGEITSRIIPSIKNFWRVASATERRKKMKIIAYKTTARATGKYSVAHFAEKDSAVYNESASRYSAFLAEYPQL
jgi:hypothetical protein